MAARTRDVRATPAVDGSATAQADAYAALLDALGTSSRLRSLPCQTAVRRPCSCMPADVQAAMTPEQTSAVGEYLGLMHPVSMRKAGIQGPIPGARLLALEHGGHIPVDHLEEVVAAVQDFLKNADRSILEGRPLHRPVDPHAVVWFMGSALGQLPNTVQ